MTDSEWTPPVIEPEEGETYMQAYERMIKEVAGIGDISEPVGNDGVDEPLGVLTGQVPVRSMPIAIRRRTPGEIDDLRGGDSGSD